VKIDVTGVHSLSEASIYTSFPGTSKTCIFDDTNKLI